MDQRAASLLVEAIADPIAHGREIATARGGVPQPSRHAREYLAARGREAVDVRVLEDDARRLEASGGKRLEGGRPAVVPAVSGERWHGFGRGHTLHYKVIGGI